MITNITIGQYYPTKSVIHSLDARVKLYASFVYIAMLFLASNVYAYLLAFSALVGMIILSNVPVVYMLRGLKAIFFIIIFTVTLNIFFTQGETILFTIFGVSIYLEGVTLAVKMATRLIMLVISSSVLTLTTSPIQLTDAIEHVLNPLKKIGVPAHEIAMMMTIALRFIPTILDEMSKIMKAQMARGADFDTGGLIKKSKSLLPLLVPLFVSAFKRADELAMAMEARCYRGSYNRTRMKQMKLVKRDLYAIFCMASFVFLIIVANSIF